MKRNYGLDILRIISMIGIVGLHLFGQGGIISNTLYNTANWWTTTIVYTIIFCSVNIFAMITGYLYIKKKDFKHESIVKLLINTIFYCIIITILFYGFNLFNIRSYGIKTIITSLFPPIIYRYWYITCYVFVFFMIPYINTFLRGINKENYRKLLICLFIFFSVITTLGIKDYFRINNGYSPFWLIYCYMIGAYIKLYPNDIKYNNYKLVLFFIINIIIVTVSKFISYILFKNSIIHDILLQYNSPFIFLNSIALLIIFSRIQCNKFNKLITIMSSTSFGVYLIHCHPLIYDYILKDKYIIIKNFNCIYFITYIIISLVGIYFICSIIDILRKYLFQLIKLDKISSKMGKLIDKYFLIEFEE